MSPVVGAHIGVTSRPAITEIEKLPLRPTVTAINYAGRAKRRAGVAVWTFDLFLLRHKIITSKGAPKTAQWRLFVQKSTIPAAFGLQTKLQERTCGRVWGMPFDVFGKGGIKSTAGQCGAALGRLHFFAGQGVDGFSRQQHDLSALIYGQQKTGTGRWTSLHTAVASTANKNGIAPVSTDGPQKGVNLAGSSHPVPPLSYISKTKKAGTGRENPQTDPRQ